jgi:hypothetical protein
MSSLTLKVTLKVILGSNQAFFLLVGGVRDSYGLFGSVSYKSTKFGPDVHHTILFRILPGAKTRDPWGRHIGKIQYGRHPVSGQYAQKQKQL